MDWIRFLEDNHIHYVTRGPNTKKGEVSIQCPICGPDDPSEHMGINLQSYKWGCHRDPSHRGKSARTLIKSLLGCSGTQANAVVQQYSASDPDSLEAALSSLEAVPESKEAPRKSCDEEFSQFKPIKATGVTKRFYDYLKSRGYEYPKTIIGWYDLRCAVTGQYKDRIIIPVHLNGELLGWTSRAIGNPRNAPRYLASSQDIKQAVFNFDELKEGGKRLFIVEGPFDALRLDSFGRGIIPSKYYHPFRATCVFGTSVTIAQRILLRSMIKRWEKVFVMFDHGAEGPALELAEWTGAHVAYLPPHVEDPGAMSLTGMQEMGMDLYPGFNFLRSNP
jgi:hypothetical protein